MSRNAVYVDDNVTRLKHDLLDNLGPISHPEKWTAQEWENCLKWYSQNRENDTVECILMLWPTALDFAKASGQIK